MAKSKKLTIGQRLDGCLLQLDADADRLKGDIKALVKAGCVRGSIHVQEKRPGYGVYYLNHSQTDGPRRREYIGRDEAKVKKVREAIEREPKRQDLVRQLEAIEASKSWLIGMVADTVQRAKSKANTQDRMW